MTQIIVEEIAKYKVGGTLHLEAMISGHRLSRDITASKVDTVQKLAHWIVTQVESSASVPEVQARRQATIDYHVDSSLGIVIDNVTVSLLVEDQMLLDIEALPGWATFTAQQAEDYIETNVTSLATAKTVMKAMARLLVAERNVIKKLVEKMT